MSDPNYEEDLVKNRFFYHSPSEAGASTHNTLSEYFSDIAHAVLRCCPDGREKSLALTKLEEAKFWASAAVARNPETR